MNMIDEISRTVAKIRFKIFRFLSIVLLGREGGQSVIGQCVSTDLEFANIKSVRDRILKRVLLSEAQIQKYMLKNIPACWDALFSRTALFCRRYAYLLKDVVIGPDSGVVYLPGNRFGGAEGVIFIPSVCHHYFFFQSGIQEVMRKAKTVDIESPVCPMPIIGYYHEMFEGLLRVVKARMIFGDIKVLVSRRRPRYIDEMLDFVGVGPGEIIYSGGPIQVKKGVLIPRWNDCGENLEEDVCEFRDYLVSRLPPETENGKKIYISRANSRRALPDEKKIEKLLEDKGFRVCYFEKMPFIEQLKTMRSAEIVIAPHGAGLSNLIVARPGTKVVELMTQGWANNCYGHLASSLGLDYTCIDVDDSRFLDRIGEVQTAI